MLALLITAISVSISFLLSNQIEFWEDYVYRLLFPIAKVNYKQIVLVMIDDNTIKRKGSKVFKRSEYAKVIDHILAGKPKVVGVDIFFDGVKDLGDDSKLIDVLEKADTNIVLGVYPTEIDNLMINKTNLLSLHPFSNYMYVTPADITIEVRPRFPVVIRGSAVPFQDRRSGTEYLPFAIVVASKYLGKEYAQTTQPSNTLTALLGDIQIPLHFLINYVDSEAFETVSFEKVTAINDLSMFRNKIVLIGTSAESIGDNFSTPISSKTPGVVIHANTIYTILEGKFISEVRPHRQLIAVFFICLPFCYGCLLVRPLPGLLFAVMALLVSVVSAIIALKCHFHFLVIPLGLSIALVYCWTIIWNKVRHVLLPGAG
jgi:CHASE2 domain-containing sensor protein